MDREKLSRQGVKDWLSQHGISFREILHPPVPTAIEAAMYWGPYDCTFCKNLFFRDHRGKQHYLALIDHRKNLSIRELEQRLRRGKLSLASDWRLEKYLGLSPGSVSPFGLLNDLSNHVILFLDQELADASCLGFHPNDNTATLMVPAEGFRKFLGLCGNPYEYLELTGGGEDG